MKKFRVVAEIGCVHGGNLERAKFLISLAKQSGADYAKFQKRNPYESVPKSQWDKPHPNEMFAYGKTYLEHRINLELTIDQHGELKEYCEKIGIGYSTSVWDMTSAKEIITLNPDYIKIPSACNHDTHLVNYIKDNFSGHIHISLGMTTKEERNTIINKYMMERGYVGYRFTWYHCVSGYPVPFEKMHLYEIDNLADKNLLYNENIGFSNHGFGIAMEPAAYVLGARWFERHFTDDRTFRHTDSAASLEPAGLQKLVRDLTALEKALTYKPDNLDEIEAVQRDKLRCQ